MQDFAASMWDFTSFAWPAIATMWYIATYNPNPNQKNKDEDKDKELRRRTKTKNNNYERRKGVRCHNNMALKKVWIMVSPTEFFQ